MVDIVFGDRQPHVEQDAFSAHCQMTFKCQRLQYLFLMVHGKKWRVVLQLPVVSLLRVGKNNTKKSLVYKTLPGLIIVLPSPIPSFLYARQRYWWRLVFQHLILCYTICLSSQSTSTTGAYVLLAISKGSRQVYDPAAAEVTWH